MKPKTVRPFATLFLLLILPFTAAAQSSLSEGTGNLRLSSAGGSHAYARVQFSDGRKAERFIVRAGDCVRSIGDCRDDRERVEFTGSRNPIQQNREMWLRWSLYIPDDFPVPASGGPSYTVGQVHQLGPSGPEFQLGLFNDGLFVIMKDPYRLDDDPMNPIPNFREIRVASPSAMRGRWHDVMLQANWTQAEDGFLNVWFNGQNVLSHQGPTTNARDPLYLKYGLYRFRVSRCGGPCPEAVVYYSDVRQGRSRADVQ